MLAFVDFEFPRQQAMIAAMKPNPHVTRRCRRLRQRPAARADRRPVPARIARARLRHGRAAQGDDGGARARLRLQDLLRQGEPHQPQGQARPRPRRGACRSSPTSARELGVPILTDVHEREQCAGGRRSRRRAADPGVPQPADRPPGRRGRDRQAGQRQEGPVPRAVGHEERRRQDRRERQPERAPHRARRELRLQHAGHRHAGAADHGGDRARR